MGVGKRNRARWRTPAVLAAALAGLALWTPKLAAQEPFVWNEVVGPGQTLEIRGFNGAIAALPASGDEAQVVATKSARRDDPGEVRIEVVETLNGYTICAVYPSRNGEPPNECRPGEEGRMRVRRNDVEVEFSVRVPAGVDFVPRTVNGAIDIDEVDANVDARTVNGLIHASASGRVRAETVNGGIDVTIGQADWDGAVEFKTVNGAITVTVPDGVSTRVEARTMNGRISSDFPITVSGRFGSRRMNGRIGDRGSAGDRELRLEAVNGGIRLRALPGG